MVKAAALSGKSGGQHSSLLKAMSALTRMGSAKQSHQKHDDRCQLAGLILAQGLTGVSHERYLHPLNALPTEIMQPYNSATANILYHPHARSQDRHHLLRQQIPASYLSVKSFPDLSSPDKFLAERYSISNGGISCKINMEVAREAGRASISQVWKAMTTSLEPARAFSVSERHDYALPKSKPRPFRHKVVLTRERMSDNSLDLPDHAFIRSL